MSKVDRDSNLVEVFGSDNGPRPSAIMKLSVAGLGDGAVFSQRQYMACVEDHWWQLTNS